MKKRTVLLVGATGLIGGYCLRYLQDDPDVERIVVLTRRRLDGAAIAAKTTQVQIDFERLRDHADQFSVDQVFICLGTTLKAAGSKKAFTRVDYDLQLEVARVAAEHKVADLFLVSSLGADQRSPFFYLKTKGLLEAAIERLPFRSITVLRPSSLVGQREKPRLKEDLVARFNSLFGFLFVGPIRKYKPINGEDVARAMVQLAAAPGTGLRVVDSAGIERQLRGFS